MILVDSSRIELIIFPVKFRKLRNFKVLFFEIVQVLFVSKLKQFHSFVKFEG